MTRHRLSNAVTAVAAAGVLLGALGGCSQKEDAPASAPAAPPAAAKAKEVISPPKLTSVPDLKKPTGIIKDATMASCSQAKGPVKATGTVTNSGDQPSDLVVVVSWIVPQGSDVVARGVAVVKDAKPGSKHDWSVASAVAADQQVQCVLSARRGDIAKT